MHSLNKRIQIIKFLVTKHKYFRRNITRLIIPYYKLKI